MFPNFPFTGRRGATIRSRAATPQGGRDLDDVESTTSWGLVPEDDRPAMAFRRSPTQEEGQTAHGDSLYGRLTPVTGGAQGQAQGYGFGPVSQDHFQGRGMEYDQAHFGHGGLLATNDAARHGAGVLQEGEVTQVAQGIGGAPQATMTGMQGVAVGTNFTLPPAPSNTGGRTGGSAPGATGGMAAHGAQTGDFATGDHPYLDHRTKLSSIDGCIARMGWSTCHTLKIKEALLYQQEVKGEAMKIANFKMEVGSLLNFQAFLMMLEGSAMVTIIHSITKHFSLSPTTMRYQGRYIGFVGDRLPTREPGPVMHPVDKGWGWVKKKVHSSLDELEAVYGPATSYGKRWVPTVPGGTESELHVPHMLLLPPHLVKVLRATRKALMPHKVAAIFVRKPESVEGTHATKDAYNLALDWCLMASQAEGPNKDSLVAFGLDAVTKHDHDPALARWLETRLDVTLGQRQAQTGIGAQVNTSQPPPGGQGLAADIITQAVGQGLALGYQHLIVPQQRGDPAAATAGLGQSGKTGDMGYSSDEVCTVMTFSGIELPCECQEMIWTIFGKKKHNVDICRIYIMKGLLNYAHDHRTEVDRSIYLEQETMKSIMDLKFNPGEGTAYVQSAAKGLSLLCCRA